jgi:hypothetical protein
LTVKLVSVTFVHVTFRIVEDAASAGSDERSRNAGDTSVPKAMAMMAARPQRLPSQPIVTSPPVRRGSPGGLPARGRLPAALGAIEVDVV